MKNCYRTLARDSRMVMGDLLASEGYVVLTVDTAWIHGEDEKRAIDRPCVNSDPQLPPSPLNPSANAR
jgi:hypothetical protein